MPSGWSRTRSEKPRRLLQDQPRRAAASCVLWVAVSWAVSIGWGALLYQSQSWLQKEERELEKVREADQRRATKELMAAQRTDDEQRLKRNLEERLREKQEEARAREKIRLKLGPSLSP